MNPGSNEIQERRWDLSRAVDALGLAARQAGRPGLIWFAGALYPSWTPFEQALNWTVKRSGDETAIALGLLSIPLWLVIAPRLMAGLARLAHPEDWRRAAGAPGAAPGLRQAWRAGQGSILSVLGLWVLLTGMLLLVLVVVLAPLGLFNDRFPHNLDAGAGIALAPLLLFLAAYAAVLSILHQLALHSLVRNRRGVASALVHAWRIARNDPRRTFQAMLPDMVLAITIAGATWLLTNLTGRSAIVLPLVLALHGFMGVARAAYWAQAYRALGGLAPEDGVPGLELGAEGEATRA